MERRAIAIEGTVQGVGFRPFVHGLAERLRLGGFVRNLTGGVEIEVEGAAAALDEFVARLTREAPPLARIERLTWRPQPPRGDRQFRIEASGDHAAGPVVVAPDAATCDACLAELFDPRDRRSEYPFLSCTHCGPRLTVITGAPYDRPRTTLVGFPLCPACQAEYDDPADRRFHAQTTACPVCGPRLQLLDGEGRALAHDRPVMHVAQSLLAGRTAAIKGLGGYHLTCDATSAAAIALLRSRKHREEKPLAVMVRDVAAAEALCEVSPAERALLTAPGRPIVLLRRRRDAPAALEQAAPGNPHLGVMLPYTPLHHLLMRDVAGRPLVMTSGNRTDEPIATDEADAVARLLGIADVFLTHDRPIHVRCDDSVTRVIAGVEAPVRRSRGYAPQPLTLPTSLRCDDPILAVGGQLKATFALGHAGRAVLSHHLGDLDHALAYAAFERDIELYEELFAIKPTCIAHDAHPDYASTQYALRRQARDGTRCVAVQHHHAHLASCMAEHGLSQRVIGVTFDGTGYGPDSAVWGGEILVGDYLGATRAAHLLYVGMPGGEQAIRQPWRMAAAHLLSAGASCDRFERRIDALALRTVRRMLERGLNCPLTSSAGRLFDAVAALAGVRDTVSYEGQAAMQLEWLASTAPPDSAYPFEILEIRHDGLISGSQAVMIDCRPMIGAVARDVDAGASAAAIARRFHTTMVEVIADICERVRQTTGIKAVVLSGGVFMNAILTMETQERLTRAGFDVFRHRKVPTNDGGLSLGQLAVAAAQMKS